MKPIQILMGSIVLAIVGCTPDPKSGKGFTLPQGDVERGKNAFTQLNCQACHSVVGVTFSEASEPTDSESTNPESTNPESANPESAVQKMVALGGAKTKVQTYGDLVTSIINPSHRFAKGYDESQISEDGESKMRKYNDVMTAEQLIDLVAFLESHYSVKQYNPTPYGPYYY